MSELSNFLVESILNEETERAVALFGGGFKPPTKGHLEVVNQGIKTNPEVSEVKILVGGGTRNGFTQSQSVKIWNLYNDIGFINKPATIIPVSSPFTYYKEYLKDNPDDKVFVFIGSRPDDEKDQMDVKQRSEFVKKYSDNVIPVEISTTGGVSGTEARKLFKTDIDSFRQMLPPNLTDDDFKKIVNILNNNEKSTPKPESNKTEPLKPINEDIIDKTDFVLPRGKKMILQAEDEDYDRGLIIELTEEGGYKMNYWYGEDAKVYPVEVEVDGESIKPDANEVYMKFHPELEKENIDPKSQAKHKGKSAPFGSAYEPLNENATYSSKIDYKQQIIDLTKHMLDKGMNIKPLPKVIFKHGDQENASQFLGKTAYYDPNDMTVVLYTEGRHPKDIVRSFAHEMIHHIQNLEGRLGGINTTNTMEDDNLNDIEREAYTKGNMTFRNWTDNKDGEEVTSLSEGPQFGVLYHFTEFLLDVLDDNMLRGPVSLTRSKDSFVTEWLGDQPYFILDKDKLRTKYKIRPYKDTSDNPDYEEISQYDEMEEVIDTDVTNLSKYIIKVVLPEPNEEYEDALKEKGIPYEIDKPLNEGINEYDNSGPTTPKVYIVKDDGIYKEAPIELLSKISNLTYDMGGGETNYYPEKNIVIVDNIPVEEFAKEPGDIKGEKVYVEYNLNNSTSLPKASKIIASQLVYHLDNHEAFAQTVANSLKDGGTFEFQSDKMNKRDKMFLQHLSDEYGFGLPTKLNQYKQEPLPLKKGKFIEPVISYIYKITDKDGKTATLSTTKKGNSWEWKKIDGDIDFKTGGWSQPPEDTDPDFKSKENTLGSFNKYLSYFGDSNTIVDFEKLNEANKPYKHKHGFDDKLGKDPFGLNQFARELMGETEKPTTEHLEDQEEVRIFTTNCGCDKAKRTI